MFSSLDVLNKVFVGKESFWAMIFYALFTTLIFAFAIMDWVAPTMIQYALAALLLVRMYSVIVEIIFHGGHSALAPFRYGVDFIG